MRIKIVLAVGLALIAGAVFVTLLHSPATVAATNGIAPSAMLMTADANAEVCQANEAIPAGTNAIRLWITATTGPRVTVHVLRGRHQLTQGAQGTAWYGGAVTVRVEAVQRAARHATVCFQLRDLSGEVQVYGSPTRAHAAQANGKQLPGRVAISYLRPSSHSWLSMASSVIGHMELGHAASGSVTVIVAASLAAAAIALGVWTASRELR